MIYRKQSKNIDIIAPDCLVISEEFFLTGKIAVGELIYWQIDKQANLVVIELKRDEKLVLIWSYRHYDMQR